VYRDVNLNKYFNPFYIYKYKDQIIPYFIKKYYKISNFICFESAKRSLFLSENQKLLASLKDIHKGRRCFIIGNGPSLKTADLEKLSQEITFAANKIYLAFDQTNWRPSYYVITDGLVAKQNYNEINELVGFPKLISAWATERWHTPFKNAIYFRYKSYETFPKPPGFEKNIIDKIYAGRTVIYACIQLACFMGIKEIFLLGMDFNFIKPSNMNNEILYSEGEVNHFHPEYRKIGEKWQDPKLEYQEKAFQVANESITQLGGRIYNATRGGKLEVFNRVDFDSLF
jgi:hypothetical protein